MTNLLHDPRFAGLLARRERVAAAETAKREARRAAGLCTKCGQAPPAEDRAMCEPCLEYFRAYNRRLRRG